MRLAEALQERADLNSKISDLEVRLDRNILVQEGEAPNEEPKDLKKELDDCIERLAYLISASIYYKRNPGNSGQYRSYS